jgi:hypothetical protein
LEDKSDAEAKGYKSIKLAAATVGSEKGRAVDQHASQAKVARANGAPPLRFAMVVIGGMNALTGQSTADDEELAADVATAAQLTDQVRQLVRDIYEEATNQLTSKVSAKITARGLETPLGILDLEQIADGEAILGRIQDHLTSTGGFVDQGSVAKLSGEV